MIDWIKAGAGEIIPAPVAVDRHVGLECVCSEPAPNRDHGYEKSNGNGLGDDPCVHGILPSLNDGTDANLLTLRRG
jgi:hypothetical protein